jgi:hypothetical protein
MLLIWQNRCIEKPISPVPTMPQLTATSTTPRRAPRLVDAKKTEHRMAARNLVRLAGEISYGDRKRRLACAIVDMSATGACIAITPSSLAGRFHCGQNDRIELYLDRNSTSVECVIVWTRDEQLGIKFCSQFKRHQKPM